MFMITIFPSAIRYFFVIQAEVLAETFYNSIDTQESGRVDSEMFKQAILKDKSLLEFFSLIITGMSDGFIQKNIERLKLQIFLNKITTVQKDVETIKELMNELLVHLPPEFQHIAKHIDIRSLKKSALFYELKSIGESRKRKVLSKKIERKILEDDEDLLNPSIIKEVKIQMKETDKEDGALPPLVRNKDKFESDEDLPEPNPGQNLHRVTAVPVDSFEGNSLDLDNEDDPSPNKPPPQQKTFADNMISTPKLHKLVNRQFWPRQTLHSVAESAEADASITRQIVNKLDAVFAKLDTLKRNLADNEGALKDQIGTRMAADVKKNMGVAATPTKNKLLFILHDSWAVMASMMMGIQKSTNSLLTQSFALKDTDFKQQYTFELRPAQVTSKDNEIDAYSKSIFYDYAPYVFKDIRRIFNIPGKSVAH